MSRPATALPLIRPRRWRESDTLGLFNPSGAIRERGPFEQTHETLATLGFKVQEAPHARGRYGHMAGTPAQRASDIHTDVHDFGPLHVPVFRGAPLGHVEHQITLPLGVPAEMGTGTLRLLEPAVC